MYREELLRKACSPHQATVVSEGLQGRIPQVTAVYISTAAHGS